MFRHAPIVILLLCLASLASAQQEGETIKLFNGAVLEGWHMDVPAVDDDPDGTKPFVVRAGKSPDRGGCHWLPGRRMHATTQAVWLFGIANVGNSK
jgi:hypothetical protein